MSTLTIGGLAGALDGIANSLSAIIENLSQSDLDAEIDSTNGRRVICSLPIVVADVCVAPSQDEFTVADIHQTMEGLMGWVRDVQSKLGDYDPETLLDAGTWPSQGEESV